MQEAVFSEEEVMGRWLKWAWVLVAFAVLAGSLLLYDGKPNSDADVLLGYAMLALSFPLGSVLAAGFGFLARFLFETAGHIFTASYASMFAAWLALFIAGYLQWFVFVPKLWGWWRAPKDDSNLLP